MERRVRGIIGGVCGLLGVAANVLGIVVLGPIPAAYHPGTITTWVQQTIAAPVAASASAIAFTLGLVVLVGWAVEMAARLESPLARAAAIAISAGALLDAAATPAPLVLALYLGPACAGSSDCTSAGIALLGTSLFLDAAFNLLLGIGLILLGVVLRRRATSPSWLAWLLIVAGITSLPVSLQWQYEAAARLLAVAGPLWLAAVTATSIYLWRDRL